MCFIEMLTADEDDESLLPGICPDCRLSALLDMRDSVLLAKKGIARRLVCLGCGNSWAEGELWRCEGCGGYFKPMGNIPICGQCTLGSDAVG
jgi:hypothetical protein